ncbi:PfkB family carbohydrate kinase [Desulforhopalus sp. 52FAK]
MGRGVFLGLTTIDIFNYVSRYPASNEKLRAGDQMVYAGGPAANAAVAYGAFGNDVQLITALGKQSLADLAKDDLEKHSVDIVDLAADPELLPVLSSIIIDESSGDRSVVYSDTTGRKLISDVAIELEGDTSVVMLDGFYLPQALQLAEQSKNLGIPVVLDGGSWKEGLEELLPMVDYGICSANFIPPGCNRRDEVVLYLRKRGIRNIAITGGGAPIYAWMDGVEREIVVEDVDVVDTLGAGDILHGAFSHFIQFEDFFESLQMAATVASQSCTVKGTRAWMVEGAGKGVNLS